MRERELDEILLDDLFTFDNLATVVDNILRSTREMRKYVDDNKKEFDSDMLMGFLDEDGE